MDCSQAEDFYSLNEDVAAAAAAATAAAEEGGAGEPSNELATYTLPEQSLPAAPLRRGPKKNNRCGFGF